MKAPSIATNLCKDGRYLLTGNKTDIKPEAERLLQAINKYIHYQLEKQGSYRNGQDLTPLTPLSILTRNPWHINIKTLSS